MKEEYPIYRLGDLVELENKVSAKNRKILNDFYEFLKISAGEKKALKNKKHLLQFYDITEKDLDKIEKEDVNGFLVVLNKSHRSMWTKNEIKVYIRKFLKWYYKNHEMIENIKLDSRRDLNPQKINENNLVTKEDVERMLRFAESFKEKAYLFLSFETGARPQELADLKWQSIKFEDKYADINLFSSKTKQSRNFPVNRAREFLWEWKQNYSFPDIKPKDYVFPSRLNRDKPITTAALNKMLRRMSVKAGLDKDVWNYLMRHSTATRLYEELPTPIVEKFMGHKNMSGIYAHISSKKAREEMLNKIYNIEELTQSEKGEIKELKENFGKLQDKLKVLENKPNEVYGDIEAFMKLTLLQSQGKITKKQMINNLRKLTGAIAIQNKS